MGEVLMKTRLILGAALIAAQFAPVPAFARSASVREPFTQIFFAPTDGRVGYHLVTQFSLPSDDAPTGNTGRPSSGSCQAGWDYTSHSGDLPPGIEQHLEGAILFKGTPRQPGQWKVTVNLVVGCRGGPDVTHYERKVPVTFNIEP